MKKQSATKPVRGTRKPAPPAFDPDAPAMPGAGLFGLPFRPEDAQFVVVPVPWEVTTSYGGGTSKAPEAILAR